MGGFHNNLLDVIDFPCCLVNTLVAHFCLFSLVHLLYPRIEVVWRKDKIVSSNNEVTKVGKHSSVGGLVIPWGTSP